MTSKMKLIFQKAEHPKPNPLSTLVHFHRKWRLNTIVDEIRQICCNWCLQLYSSSSNSIELVLINLLLEMLDHQVCHSYGVCSLSAKQQLEDFDVIGISSIHILPNCCSNPGLRAICEMQIWLFFPSWIRNTSEDSLSLDTVWSCIIFPQIFVNFLFLPVNSPLLFKSAVTFRNLWLCERMQMMILTKKKAEFCEIFDQTIVSKNSEHRRYPQETGHGSETRSSVSNKSLYWLKLAQMACTSSTFSYIAGAFQLRQILFPSQAL